MVEWISNYFLQILRQALCLGCRHADGAASDLHLLCAVIELKLLLTILVVHAYLNVRRLVRQMEIRW